MAHRPAQEDQCLFILESSPASRSLPRAPRLSIGVAGGVRRGRSCPPRRWRCPPASSKAAPDLKSAGALAFGPDSVLFVGDSRGGAVFALSIDDSVPDPHRGEVEIDNMEKRMATLLVDRA